MYVFVGYGVILLECGDSSPLSRVLENADLFPASSALV